MSYGVNRETEKNLSDDAENNTVTTLGSSNLNSNMLACCVSLVTSETETQLVQCNEINTLISQKQNMTQFHAISAVHFCFAAQCKAVKW